MNVLDTFNRANESPVSDGARWTIGGINNPATGPKVVSNKLVRQSASGTFGRDGSYRNNISFAANVDCQVGATVAQMSNDGELDLSLFNTTTRSGYQMVIQSTTFSADQLALLRSDAGTTVTIDANRSFAPATADVYVLQIIGNDIACWRNRSNVWLQMLGATDTTYRVTFNPGIEIVGNVDTTPMIADDFGANIIPAPNTVVFPVDAPLIYMRRNV